jgi:hypothetical protein
MLFPQNNCWFNNASRTMCLRLICLWGTIKQGKMGYPLSLGIYVLVPSYRCSIVNKFPSISQWYIESFFKTWAIFTKPRMLTKMSRNFYGDQPLLASECCNL